MNAPAEKSQTIQQYFFLPIIFGGYLLTKPFYVFSSGLPQPADIIVFILIVSILFSRPIECKQGASAACGYAVSFTVYVVIISLCHAFWERDLTIAISPVYYAFNTVIFIIVVYLSQRYEDIMLRMMLYTAVISVYIQLVSMAIFFGDSIHNWRENGFFNNPNQLGYWSLLSASLILLLSRRLRASIFMQTTAFFSCLYLTMSSSSRAALVSMFVLGILHAMKRTGYAIITISTIVLVWQIVSYVPIGKYVPAYEHAVERLEGIGAAHSDDNIEDRGYYRILENPEYLFFGAAEGGLERFSTDIEIHSTFGTVLFSYGIVGLILFLAMIIYVCKAGGMPNALYLIPSLVYGFAHQGLRFGLLYVLLAAVAFRRDPLPTAADDNVKPT